MKTPILSVFGAMTFGKFVRVFKSTIGLILLSKISRSLLEISAISRAIFSLAHIIASGFSGRNLRSLSRKIALSFFASHIKWNPPSPFAAMIAPSFSLQAANFIASLSVAKILPFLSFKKSFGPQISHAIGSAWKRLFCGFLYSFSHSLHNLKAPIDVFLRSYGKAWIIDRRGPQFTQFINA